jgi:hypothetical protein
VNLFKLAGEAVEAYLLLIMVPMAIMSWTVMLDPEGNEFCIG